MPLLVQGWKKLSTCWCRHPKTSIARGRNKCRVPILIKSFLCLSYHRCNHPVKQCNTQNQVHSSEVNNHNIDQCANTINQKHNVNPLMRGLKGKRQKNVGLFIHNMKIKIYYDGCKHIPHNIMGCHPPPPWTQWKRWIPMGSKDWPEMQCEKPRANEWGRPNLMCIAKEKTFETKLEKRMIKQVNN